jgi:hypothetical protein
MSRFRLMLLGVLAVVAVSAVSAATATAEGPYWVACQEVAEGTGKYTNSKCATEGAPKTWEWYKLTPFDELALESEGGPFVLNTVFAGKATVIRCNKETDSGYVYGTMPGTDNALTLFTECQNLEIEGAEVVCKPVEPITVGPMPTILRYVVRVKGSGGAWEVVSETVYNEDVAKKAPETEYEGRFADEFKPPAGSGGVFVTMKFTGGGCGLLKSAQIKGSELGLVNNATEALEFNAQTSKLKFGAEAATLTGTSTQKVTTAGYGALKVE